MTATSKFFPTARIRLQRTSGQRDANEYRWNRGNREDGIQFEGSLDTTLSTEGVESILDLKLFNVPREQRGEVPLESAIVTLDLGYEDDGPNAFNSVFAGRLKYGTPSMDGATSVWSLYATLKSKLASGDIIEWTPAWKNDNSGVVDQVSLGTIVSAFALRAGITVVMTDDFKNATVSPTTFSGTAMDVINTLIEKASRDLGRPFLLTQIQDAYNSYAITDVHAQPVVFIDSSQESVYHAGYAVAQNQKAVKAATAADGTIEQPDATDDKSYALYYEMELPFRPEVKTGVYVNLAKDPRTGAPVTFFVTSIHYDIGKDWAMSIRGPVDGAKGLVVN